MSVRMGTGIKRSAFLIATLLIVTLAMRWSLMRGRAERLFPLPSTGQFRLLGVRDGEAIFLDSRDNARITLQARQLQGGPFRQIGEDGAMRNGFSIVLAEDALYYKTAPNGEAPPAGVGIVPQAASAGGAPAVPGVGASVVAPSAAGIAPQASSAPTESAAGRTRAVMASSQAAGAGGLAPAASRTPTRSAAAGRAAVPSTMATAAGIQPTGLTPSGPPPPWPLEGAGDPPGSPNLFPGRPSRTTLRRIDLKSGKVANLRVPLNPNPYTQRDYAVLGKNVYFTRFTPERPPRTDAPLAIRKKCYVELLKQSVEGGPVTRVLRVPGMLSTLYGTKERIQWIVARPEDPTRVDLYHFSDNDKQPLCVRDYQSWFPAAEAAGRLYWISRNFIRPNSEASYVKLDSSNLMSTQLDGRDRCIVARVVDRGKSVRDMWRPIAHRDRVYVHVREQLQGPEETDRREVLYSVKTDLSGLERVKELPTSAGSRGSFIEGGWYYFGLVDRRQSLFEYLRRGERQEFNEALYRVRLPDI